MIDTVNTQAAHYADGCWRSGTGELVIVIMGSCRVLPYTNYLHRINQDNRFTICLINLVNFMQNVDQYEEKPILLDMIKRCKWFLHEHSENFGFLNTCCDLPKNIYQHGMHAEIDISIPNWNDVMVLANDYIAYGTTTPADYTEKGETAIEKFCNLCSLTSFPEMADRFRDNWRKVRYFYRPNHISAEFSLYIFRRMNEKFLNLDLSGEFWQAAAQEDLYKTPCTQVTQQDREAYGITW